MTFPELKELELLLHGQSWFPLREEVSTRILHFYEAVLRENQKQNLTRLVSPQDFFVGHVQDVLHLLSSNLVRYPALDLGSGVGVPGLLASIIAEQSWVLCESEGRKAEFLQNTVDSLQLGSLVSVFNGRAEEYLLDNKVSSVVVRAVGTVEKIYSWIRNCSTWNSLVLMKGPRWDEEWANFQQGKGSKELKVVADYSYSVKDPSQMRKIVSLERVPRGTVSRQ